MKSLIKWFMVFVIIYLFCAFHIAQATDVTLAWDANAPEDNVIGYRLYHGLAPGAYIQSKGGGIETGNQTQWMIPIEADDQEHYFSVTAYNADGESDYSNEVSLLLVVVEDPPPEDPPDVIISNFVLTWLDAEEFNGTYFGNTGKAFTITWDVTPIVETTYNVRLYDINKRVYLPEEETSVNNVTMIIASTGAYKVELQPLGNEWITMPFRIVAWISAPGQIIID